MREALKVGGGRRELLLGLTIAAIVAFFATRNSFFLSFGNLANIADQSAALMIIALGMTAVILVRGIDLSVAASLALSSVCGGLVMNAGGGAALTIVSTVCVATMVGLLNGVLIAVAGIAPFMATLGTLGVCTGAALALSQSSSILISSRTIQYLGFGQLGGIPVSAICAVLVAVLLGFGLRVTRWGRQVYATGGSPEAARLALVPSDGIVVSCYVLQGVCVGLVAVLTMGRLGSAQPVVDSTIAFSAISAVIIGGTRLTGGIGTLSGTFLGVLLLGIVNVGLSFSNASPEVIKLILGGIIVVAVASTELRIARLTTRSTRDASSGALPGDVVVQIRGLSKRFGAAVAVHDVSFDLHRGEVMALVGENGAGKTTLVGLMSGELAPDAGHVVVSRASVAGEGSGVAVVHQHLATLSDLSVWENLFLGTGEFPAWKLFQAKRMRQRAQSKLNELGIPIHATETVSRLTLGERQMLEIARAFVRTPTVVILDEATSAISQEERDILHGLVRGAAQRGTCIVYISHRMNDIYEIADRVVVLRDGGLVADHPLADITQSELVSLMVGRSVDLVFPHVDSTSTDNSVVLSVDRLSDGLRLRDASLTVHAGEIVGLAGLLGSGRSELLRCIAGHNPSTRGVVEICGENVTRLGPQARAQRGVAFVPEDRHYEGLIPSQSVRFNLSLPWLAAVRRFWIVSRARERAKVSRAIVSAGIRPSDPELPIGQLSGGNQQKVLLARWLEVQPKLLVLDEPTRGVDVGAKAELHVLIGEAKRNGAAVLMVSSELPELIGVSDRIVVMREGFVVGEVPRGATEEDVARLWFIRDAPRGIPEPQESMVKEPTS